MDSSHDTAENLFLDDVYIVVQAPHGHNAPPAMLLYKNVLVLLWWISTVQKQVVSIPHYNSHKTHLR